MKAEESFWRNFGRVTVCDFQSEETFTFSDLFVKKQKAIEMPTALNAIDTLDSTSRKVCEC